jgi:rubrerythrin
MDWFGFVNQQNIERYRRLLDKCTDEAQRETIFKLLSEEQEKLRTSASEAINAASRRFAR